MIPHGEKRMYVKLGDMYPVKLIDGENYPSHEAIDFIIVIKKILNYLRKWALKLFVQVLHGLEFSSWR